MAFVPEKFEQPLFELGNLVVSPLDLVVKPRVSLCRHGGHPPQLLSGLTRLAVVVGGRHRRLSLPFHHFRQVALLGLDLITLAAPALVQVVQVAAHTLQLQQQVQMKC